MKTIMLLFTLIFFLSCQQEKEIKDYEIVELPIEYVDGYGPFNAGFGYLSFRPRDTSGVWGKASVETTGVPDHWEQPVVKQIWFDARQFAYQNFLQGTLDSAFFENLTDSWNIDLKVRPLSKEPIKCFTHIVMSKTEEGDIRYKIDTNNNRDFSDDAEVKPLILSDWSKIDSLSQFAHRLSYESFVNGKVENLETPLLIVKNDRGSLMYNFPIHATSVLGQHNIRISSGFGSPNFDGETSIVLYDSLAGKVHNPIERNEFVKIEGETFQNLGVNWNRQLLQLKKMPSDSMLHSSQVGFYAIPFSGSEFSTGDSIKLSDYAGKHLYLEFWGSWCGPCIGELPNLKLAYDSIPREKIEFLGIAEDSPKALRNFLDKDSIPWQQILSIKENDIVDTYGVNGFPTSFLIDPSGKIIAKNLRGEKLLDTLNYYINPTH